MDYNEIAPMIMNTGLTEEIIEPFLIADIADDNLQPPEPEITKAKVKVIGKIFLDGTISKENGFVAIGQKVGLTTQQVKNLFKELHNLKEAKRIELENA